MDSDRLIRDRPELLKCALRAPGAAAWTRSTLAGGTMAYRGSYGAYTSQTLDPTPARP